MSTRYNPDTQPVPGTAKYLDAQRKASNLIYPPHGFNLDNPPEVWQVAANEIAEYQIELGASVTSIQQPVAVANITDIFLVPDLSCYVMSDQESKIITPDIWRNNGGKIRVTINDDTTTATVKIFGAALPGRSPFWVGFDDGANQFSGIFLLGQGIKATREEITVYTGLSDDLVGDDSTATLDNPYIQSLEGAWDAAHAALGRELGNFQTLAFTTTGVDVDGVDAQNTEDAMGRIAGARVIFDNAFYRVRTATVTENAISVTAEQDTTVGDFNRCMPAGLTFDQWSALWASDAVIQDANTDPLNGGDLDA